MPAELTPLAFRLDGEITSMLVKEGDVVTKGQIIAVLDDTKARQKLVDAQARYELALKQVKRGQESRSNKMISDSELDELSANFELAKANLGARRQVWNICVLKRLTLFHRLQNSMKMYRLVSKCAGLSERTSLRKNRSIRLGTGDARSSVCAQTISPQHLPGMICCKVTYLEHTSELNQTVRPRIVLKMPQVEQAYCHTRCQSLG